MGLLESFTQVYIPKRGLYVMQEIHEGVCGNHAWKMSLLHKVARQGYYWPNMVKDVKQYVRRCDSANASRN